MKSSFLRTVSIVTATALLVGCGGGGGTDSVTPAETPTQSQGTAPANKGPFALGSTVTAYKLNSDGSRGTETNSTKTIDNKGTFTISVPWEGPTELNIVGEYLNETTGIYMNDGDLSAIVDMKSEGTNSLGINIFTHMAVSIIRKKMASSSGADFATLKEESKEVIANQFNLKLDSDTALEDLDVTSSDEDANIQLLQISAALMNTQNPAETLANISEDLSDGEVDDEGQAALEELDEEMEKVDIVAVAQNIENNVAGSDAPEEFNVLNGTLAWDSNIVFTSLNDAPLNTQQTSSIVTVDGVIGDEANLTIVNGNYSLNGVVGSSLKSVRNGDQLALIGTSSSSYNSESKVVVTIGGETIPFVIRTKADPDANDDAVPNEFNFGFKKNIATNSSVRSDEVVVSGINTATSISIDNGTFTVNGSSVSEVNSGDRVVVTLTSGALGETKKATVTIGGVEGKFVVSSESKDSMPVIIGSFQSVVGVEKATSVVSHEITITDINVDVPVSISGAELSINGADFITSGTVSIGDKVKVRVTSANAFDSKKEVYLSIGTVVVPFITQTKSDPVVPDKVPNSFSFNAQTTRVANTPINSESITISSINEAVKITVKDGKYSVNGRDFRSDETTVNAGDKVVLQVLSADYGSSEKARVTIGGVSAMFSVTTIKDDTLDLISFNSKDSVGRNVSVESDAVTISGVNVPMPVSIVGGEYSIDGSEYVSSEGTVTEGETLKVRVTSSATSLVSQSAVLRVGNLQLPFVVTTQASISPVSAVDSAETFEDTMVVIDVLGNDSDVDGDSLAIANLSTPAHGSAVVVAGKVNYTPSQDFVGTDTFTYQATDGAVTGNAVTVTVTVTAVNDAPMAEDKAVTVAEDAEQIITLTSTDVDGDTPTFTIVNQPIHGSVTLDGTLATYIPNKDYVGADSFTYSASDASETSNIATVNITVTDVGDAPLLTAIDDRSMDEDASPITIELTASDIDGDDLTFEATSSDETKAIVSVVGTTLTVAALPNMSGEVTVSVTANDGIFRSSPEIFTVTINPLNDTPVATADNVSVDEDGAVTIDVLANDSDEEGTTLSITNLTTPVNGSVDIVTGKVVYTPNENFNGVDSFTYTPNDGEVDGLPVTVNVIVSAINDAPVAVENKITTDKFTAITMDVLANDRDIDGDTLTISSVTIPNSGTATIVDNKILYTPSGDFNGMVNLSYVVSDGSLTSTAGVIIDIANVQSKLITAIHILEGTDFETDDVKSKLDEVKTTLNSADALDKDAKVGQAIFALAEITNSEEIGDLIDITLDGTSVSYADNLPRVIKGLSSEEALEVSMVENITDMSAISTTVLHNFVLKLQDIETTLGESFEDESYVFSYNDMNLTANQSKLLRASVLATASKLEYIAAFNYLTQDDLEPKSITVDGVTAEYSNIGSNPIVILNRTDVGALNSATRLTASKNLLLSSIALLNQVDASKESDSEDREAIEKAQSEASKVKGSLNGTAPYVIENDEDERVEKIYINFSALYNESSVLDMAHTIGHEFSYESYHDYFNGAEHTTGSYHLETSQFYNDTMSNQWVATDGTLIGYVDGQMERPTVDVRPVVPMGANTHIPLVVTKVEVVEDESTTTYEGDNLLRYLFNDIDLEEDNQHHQYERSENINIIYRVEAENMIPTAGTSTYNFELLTEHSGLQLTSVDGTTARLSADIGLTGNFCYRVHVSDTYGHSEERGMCLYIDLPQPHIELSQHEVSLKQGETQRVGFNLVNLDSVQLTDSAPDFVTIDGSELVVSPTTDTSVNSYIVELNATGEYGESHEYLYINVIDENTPDVENLSTKIIGTTQYFANASGVIGYRYYADNNTYKGRITLTDSTVLNTYGTYSIDGNVVSINRESPSEYSLTLTYVGEESGGMVLTVNSGENSTTSISFISESERDAYVTSFQERFSNRIVGSTQYFANSSGSKGYRNYSEDNTYTGRVTSSGGTVSDVSGTYSVDGNVVSINRTSPSEYSLTLTYMGEESGGMVVTVNSGGNLSTSILFTSESERDAYLSNGD